MSMALMEKVHKKTVEVYRYISDTSKYYIGDAQWMRYLKIMNKN